MDKVYSIPAAYGFAEALAAHLLETPDPFALVDVEIYLPTRRAIRTLQAAFRDQARGRNLILPKLYALGDLDADELALSGPQDLGFEALEVPPAMGTAQRLFLLARLIDRGWAGLLGDSVPKSQHQIFAYARALMALLDTLETEGLDLSTLSKIAPEDADLQEFWDQAARFIALIQDLWPSLEAESGRISAATRRRKLLELRAEQWRADPPQNRIILAGTTATIPAVAELANVIHSLPQGQIVLPGLDPHLDVATWDLVATSPSHPQHGFHLLLSRLGLAPGQVQTWPGCGESLDLDRHWALMAAQRPVGAQAALAQERPNLDGLALAEAPTPELEARAIALFLREALEAPEAKAALVTPDRDLAGRVAAELRRWGLVIDDSAGLPLTASVAGRLIQQSAACLSNPLPTLGLATLLSHPLASFGQDPALARDFAQEMDLTLRGAGETVAPGSLIWPENPCAEVLSGFVAAAPVGSEPLGAWLDRHLAFLSLLCPDPDLLWAGPEGEALALIFEDLRAQAHLLPPLTLAAYQDLLGGFLTQGSFRPVYGTHPRLSILGTLEARLLSVDAVALGGLNEGTWPKETDVGPWMNRPKRAEVGLPSPERKVGLAAHDLAQALGAGRVLMTRALRVDGTPTLPSRWIERLKALTDQTEQLTTLKAEGQVYLSYADRLDLEPTRPEPQAGEPALANPPLSARPKVISATDIGLLVANPYAFYAKRILRLKPLSARGPEPAQLAWGNLVHDVLDQALRIPGLSLAGLLALGQERLASLPLTPTQSSLWQTQLEACLKGFWALNAPYAQSPSKIEHKGAFWVGAMRVEGRADRIVLLPDRAHVLDYKTGTPASDADQVKGLDPQLAVLALMGQAGGFEGVPSAATSRAFFHLPSRPHEQAREILGKTETLQKVQEGLETLFRAYEDPAQPYLSAPFGDQVGRADPKYDDYAHLARRLIS